MTGLNQMTQLTPALACFGPKLLTVHAGFVQVLTDTYVSRKTSAMFDHWCSTADYADLADRRCAVCVCVYA